MSNYSQSLVRSSYFSVVEAPPPGAFAHDVLEQNADETLWTTPHTRECQFRQHKQIQAVNIVLVRLGKNCIGSIQVVLDVADLRRELKTGDAHDVFVRWLQSTGTRYGSGDLCRKGCRGQSRLSVP